MELFLDHPRELLKESGFASRLSENPESWPQELTSELYKQLPFLSDYDMSVNLDRVEPQRGVAFGYADLANRTERPEIEHEDAGLPHVRIPLVVMERAVKPFSVFLDGERVVPLTEERIREVLFNPGTFDLSTSQPRDPSLVEATMPPTRSGIGMGGETKIGSVSPEMLKEAFQHISKPQWEAIQKSDKVQKQVAKYGPSSPAATNAMYETASKVFGFHPKVYSSPQSMQKGIQGGLKQPGQAKPPTPPKQKTASLLEAIAPTIRQSDKDSFVKKVASDPTIRAGFSRSGLSEHLVRIFDETKTASADEMLATLAENITPSVVTMQKLPGGDFLVKMANVNAFSGDETAMGQVVPGQEAAEAIGPEAAQSMQPGQTATAVSEPVEEPQQAVGDESLFGDSNSKVVDEFGEWLVQDSMGNSQMGWVFPQTLAWDGDFTPQPIALFTNGSAYALQEAIAGELIGKGTTFPSDTPRGDGVFYATEGGKAICTAPLTVGSATGGPDGTQTFLGQDLFGNQVQVHLVDGLDRPTRVSDVEYAMPKTWKFMRLNNQTQLVPDPVQMNKMAQVKALRDSITLFYNGSYNLEGGCGLHKLAHDFRYDLDPVSAEFMLGVLGVDGKLAKQKVAEARKRGSIKLAGLKSITLLSERYDEATKTASALISKLPNLRRDLVKEAAALEDSATVDNLLSLNFINPENITTFVSYLPELEATSEKIAEMLLTCYLGMEELPEGALERGMKNLEEVISGLRSMQHAEA